MLNKKITVQKWVFSLCVLLLSFSFEAKGQYATHGDASADLRGSIYWLTWDNSTLDSSPAAWDNTNIRAGTYEWVLPSGNVKISATISNPSRNFEKYTPGVGYEGDGLNWLFSDGGFTGTGNNRRPNGVPHSGIVARGDNGAASFNIAVAVEMMINGEWTEVDYPGLVFADAEKIDSNVESIQASTSQPAGWQLISKRARQNNAYKVSISDNRKKVKMHAAGGTVTQQAAVVFANGAKDLAVEMQVGGNTALALGLSLPFDYGDAPESYGGAGNYLNDFEQVGGLLNDGQHTLMTTSIGTLIPKARLYIGEENNVDADGSPLYSSDAKGDDDTGENDENTFPSGPPEIKVNQSGDYELSVPVANTTATEATLYAWMDFNGDGVFSENEFMSTTVPGNTSNGTVSLTYSNAAFKDLVKIEQPLFMRLRITTSHLTNSVLAPGVDARSISYAADGETEDHLVTVTGIVISGTVVEGGVNNDQIVGDPISTVESEQLYVYLVDTLDEIIQKEALSSNGVYSFAVDKGTYTVAVSTHNSAIGDALSSIPTELPGAWKVKGMSYGDNNSQTGILMSPQMQVPVVTPEDGLDVTTVDFAIAEQSLLITNPMIYQRVK